MNSIFDYRLYLVVSEADCKGRDIIQITEQAIKGGVQIVQLREKHKSFEDFTRLAVRLKSLLDTYNVPLIINDDIDVALACGARGLHVGTTDLAPSLVMQQWPQCSILGYSIEYLEQLHKDEVNYATHLGISPVFSTLTKTNTVTEWGLQGIATIRLLTTKPLVAIGRMNADNAYDVIKAGADCIAVVSAICAAEDPANAAYAIRNQIEKAL